MKNINMQLQFFLTTHFIISFYFCFALTINTTMISELMCPRSVDVKDLQGNQHSLQVQVLGTEETWNTPSLMLACNKNTTNGGKAIFSQVSVCSTVAAKYIVINNVISLI